MVRGSENEDLKKEKKKAKNEIECHFLIVGLPYTTDVQTSLKLEIHKEGISEGLVELINYK